MTISTERMAEWLAKVERHLLRELLPFWLDRAADPAGPGFLTYFDAQGERTSATDKTFLMQIRCLYTFSSLVNAGLERERSLALVERGLSFLLEYYEDSRHGGWFWIADRRGEIVVLDKIGYGQAFAMYAFAEAYRATGDERALHAMERTEVVVQSTMGDARHGGYLELFREDWTPFPPGEGGGDRKSFDVHLHLMEAFTSVYGVSPTPARRRRLEDVCALLVERGLDPSKRGGLLQFDRGWNPVPAIPLPIVWGRDEAPERGETRPVDMVSYGHDLEFVWLYFEAQRALGHDVRASLDMVLRIADHVLQHGLDGERGGVFVEGRLGHAPSARTKQFWQQAEALVAWLELALLTGDERFARAFESSLEFVLRHFVSAAGEWHAMLDEEGRPVWDYLGDAWKINYHTVRCMVRLRKLLGDVTNAVF